MGPLTRSQNHPKLRLSMQLGHMKRRSAVSFCYLGGGRGRLGLGDLATWEGGMMGKGHRTEEEKRKKMAPFGLLKLD